MLVVLENVVFHVGFITTHSLKIAFIKELFSFSASKALGPLIYYVIMEVRVVVARNAHV